ncbi:MAG: alpha-2-macroglobulin family protein [Thiobacillus sp.]|nr:alpha-2-macroglobulin family protein [Thiobacillus sp.]
MATRTGKLELYRRVSIGLLVALTALSAVTPARAVPEIPRSNFTLLKGEPFFLLSDKSFGSRETALVRLEAKGGGDTARVLDGEAGVDVAIHRVPKPLEFLRRQQNLHRVGTQAMYVGAGAGQTLNYLYDSWNKQTRRSWQRILATPARQQAVARVPGLKFGKYMLNQTEFGQDVKFGRMPGFELVRRFRYPLGSARPIAPPKDVRLAGSSSEFIRSNPGNVMLPLGQLAPGLYLVEAMIGDYRANTLVFVSDTVAVTKNAGKQMLVWAAHRVTGAPAPGVSIIWSDGRGVLQSGTTDSAGVLEMNRDSPEKSYVIGGDPAGGVFVSENFYYDSEIYNAKLYAVTDRPLYRPGDIVRVKFIGRRFHDARRSDALPAGVLKLEVRDPNGSPVLTQNVELVAGSGGNASFVLPANASAGGWELRFALGDDLYGAAFRVAEYVKPHFDIHLSFDKAAPKSGEAIEGQVRLTYPSGKPVAGGKVSLSVRAQQTTMVDGELDYAGQFPVKLEQEELTADANGIARFQLPAAKNPSRYIFNILANDGAAWRVKISRELLVERGAQPWRLVAPARFSEPGAKVVFKLEGAGRLAGARWEVIRLEDRARSEGRLADGAGSLNVDFPASGSYTVNLRDGQGNLLGAATHWVSGKGIRTMPGSIEIVTDKPRYAVGDAAELLLTFPEPVDDALLTLERDNVAHHALLSRPAAWLDSVQRLAGNQWRVRLRVTEDMAPNMTFSAVMVRNAEYVFQNAGLVVEHPRIDIDIQSDKAVYQPGETARLRFAARLAGKPVAAHLTVGVVDEMIYVLQPELAPDLDEFLHHVRRDNVRTSSSLAFIGYDLARDYGGEGARQVAHPERRVKVLERPRRDEIDTAAWFPDLRTDAKGRASASFKVPDSLTRWRITARALGDDGSAGQRRAYVQSDKALYLKWPGPRDYRDDDEPIIDVVGFNRGNKDVRAEFRTLFAGSTNVRPVIMRPGPNFFPVQLKKAHRGQLGLQLVVAGNGGGKIVDSLTVDLRSSPVAWPSPHQDHIDLAAASTPVHLPADARDLRLSLADNAADRFRQVADDLLDYPYGCVEQTSSRLIPLALARQALHDGAGASGLDSQLQAQRLRLIQMAGSDGVFGWWGRAGAESAFMTGYAYYADYFASRSLGLELPADNWRHVLEVYRKRGEADPLLQRALLLWWAKEMGLPVEGLAGGLAQQLADGIEAREAAPAPGDSLVFAAPDSRDARLASALLLKLTVAGGRLPAGADTLHRKAMDALPASDSPFLHALLRLNGNPRAWTPETILSRSGGEQPTLERAMTLAWVHRVLGGFRVPARTQLRPLDWIPQAGQWLWPNGIAWPNRIRLAGAPAAPISASLRYTAFEKANGRLPVAVKRQLYRLESQGGDLQFKALPVAPGEALSSATLYVDEVTLVPAQGRRHRYGLLEVPLPPGGMVEASTWGIQIAGLERDEKGEAAAVAFAPPEYETGQLGYRVPLAQLDGPVVTRQLVRFLQRGRFVLPPTRYFRMYQPNDKAYEADGRKSWRVR